MKITFQSCNRLARGAAQITAIGRHLGVLAALLAAVVLGGAAWAPRASAATTPRINLKVLLLGTATTEPGFQSWEAALHREGVLFDAVVGPSHTPITAAALSSTLSDGTPVANYDAIIVPVGNLVDCSSGTCLSDLSQSEWTAIEQYEHAFNIRQITGYVYPSSSYGMDTPTVSGALDGSQGVLTADGQTVFPYLKATAPVTMDTGTYGYEATPVSTTNFDTLVTGPNGSSLVGIYTHTDGVQEMVETFDQNANQLQAELLRHGALAWATRGVYFGDQRNYLETNIDDNFLADDSWNTSTHTTDYDSSSALREIPSDVDNAANWSTQNNFRIDMLFNGGGSVEFAAGCTVVSGGDGGSGATSSGCNGNAPGTDPLLAEFQKVNPATSKPYAQSFGWINHTWDHPNLDQGCATQNYIEAEIQENTNWAAGSAASAGNPNSGGLGLTEDSTGQTALGAENPGVVVTGEHSGLANLLPGNPGTVDPPSFDQATVSSTSGTLPAGTYTWAITDQFSTTGGESSASETQQTLSAPGSVTLQWQAACHAADYKIYRENMATGQWTLVTTINAPTTAPPNTSYSDPTSAANVTGGGALQQTYTDTGSAGSASSAPPTVNTATETPYQQNTNLAAAWSAIGIHAFGADSSKPYPNPATATFATGAPPSTQFAAGATFTDGGAQAVPRYPTNIYYNVSAEAQEVDEYNHLYLPPSLGGACENSSTTTCLAAPATFADIISSVDQGMFGHVVGNDPRPDYFHQTNMMGTPPAGAPTTGTPPSTSPTVGDGLYYSTMNQLLAEYNSYFSVPIVQPTTLQIATLLAEQAAWAANTSVSGYIQGNQVTITNSATTAVAVPVTGDPAVGSVYGGTQSGWTSLGTGSTTYTAPITWPANTIAVTLSPATIAADGTSTTTATATVTANGTAVAGDTITFTSTDTGETIGSVVNNGNGTYSATIKSSTKAGTATITATDTSASPSLTGQATLTQTAGTAAKVVLSLSPASIAANGTSTSTATATVTDASLNPVTGNTVAFTSSDAGEKIGTVSPNANGTYSATITSSTALGAPTITATDSSVSPSITGQATLTQTAGPAAKVTVSLSPASIVANGTSTSTVTATVTDAQGRTLGSDKVVFTANDAGDKVGGVTANSNGTYTATITASKTAHAVTITATDSSVTPSITGQATLTQTTGVAAKIAVALSPASIAANGTSTSAVTATATDAQANPVAGNKVAFTSSDTGVKIGAVTANSNGTYTATITSSKTAHAVTITATDSSVSPSITGRATLTQTTPPTPPVALLTPRVLGNATVGHALTAFPGLWLGASISYAYQWQRCNPGCSAIAGATGSSYTVATADRGARVRLAVTATNAGGSVVAYSPQVGPAR